MGGGEGIMIEGTGDTAIGASVPPGGTDTVPPNVLRRAIAASAIGNATEWFDYGIYAYGLTYISAAMFPGTTGQATLFALATRSEERRIGKECVSTGSSRGCREE